MNQALVTMINAKYIKMISLMLSILLLACQAHNVEDQIQLGSHKSQLMSVSSVDFTNPDSDTTSSLISELVAAINVAERSIDLCVFDFDEDHLVNAIVQAHERGIQIRFVGDGDEMDSHGYEALSAIGVKMSLRPAGNRIMHHKFLIVDERVVYTGSMNFSESGAYMNNNHLLRLTDPTLIARFQGEFLQLLEGKFGRKKEAYLSEEVTVNNGTQQVFFGPQERPLDALLSELEGAEHQVYFMIFSFTHPEISSRLAQLHQNGVEVIGVMDKSQAWGAYSKDEELADAGVPIYIDGNNNNIGFKGGKLHHKVMIIDGGDDPVVITGSYNWSKSASRYNDEALVILRGADQAAPFITEFCTRFEEATPHERSGEDRPSLCNEEGHEIEVAHPDIQIIATLPNPVGKDRGQEWIELRNMGNVAVDMSQWQLGDGFRSDRHIFPEDFVIEVGQTVRLLDSSTTSGFLSLNNGGDSLTLMNHAGMIMDQWTYSGGEVREGVVIGR